jgi:hypothetical protein
MTWLTLTDRAIEQILEWLEFNVVDFKNHSHGFWITEIEQCANDTPPGDDIVFEIRARQSYDGKPTTIKLLRNCFTEQTE